MRQKICPREKKLLQWRVDLVKIDVGNKTVDGRVTAAWLCPKQETARGNEVRQDSQVRDPPDVDLVALIAADALILVALEIIRPCRFERGFGYARMRSEKRVPEQRPKALTLPARTGHHPVKIIKHPPDQMVLIVLARRQTIIDRKRIARDQMGDDRVAIADGFIAVLEIGQLLARCILRIENMLVPETKLA